MLYCSNGITTRGARQDGALLVRVLLKLYFYEKPQPLWAIFTSAIVERPEISTSRPLNAHSCVGSVCGSWTADHEIAKIQGDRGGESGVGPRSIFLSMYLYTPQSEKGILNRFFLPFSRGVFAGGVPNVCLTCA